MSVTYSVSIQQEDFDVSTELARLGRDSDTVGAIVNFVGLVRDNNDNQSVSAMELEHYPGMTEASINKIVAEADQRWQLLGARVIHRIGALLPGDQIVLVAVTSMHRKDAFAACEFIMDFLKTKAPFWKKESTPEGERWVDARSSDQTALERWS